MSLQKSLNNLISILNAQAAMSAGPPRSGPMFPQVETPWDSNCCVSFDNTDPMYPKVYKICGNPPKQTFQQYPSLSAVPKNAVSCDTQTPLLA